MSNFIDKTDLMGRINAEIIEQLTGGDDTQIYTKAADSAQLIIDRLGDKYQVATALMQTGESRNRSLVRWMLSLTAYFVYSTSVDVDIPERIVKDYDDTLTELEKIASGKLTASIDRVTTADGNTPTRIRMGSNPARTHNPY